MNYNKIELSILNQKEKDIIKVINEKWIKNIHIDIMDWYFTKSLSSINPFFLEWLNLDNKKIHLHFMVNDIFHYYNYYSNIKSIEYISYHCQSKFDINKYKEFNNQIRNKWIKIWLAINPDIKISDISQIIWNFDFILIMTVIPWKGWQSFIEECWEKIKLFRKNYNLPIFIDGWVNNIIYEKYNNIVDKFIMGSYLFK